MDILSYFNRDNSTYAADGIVMFCFKNERRADFLREGVNFYRLAFVSDVDLEEDIKEMGGSPGAHCSPDEFEPYPQGSGDRYLNHLYSM